MKHSISSFQEAKNKGEKITMLTAYDYTTAKWMDKAGIQGILVGDSLGNVILGYEDTLSVTMEDMIHHSRAVARACQSALLVTDLPFMSYQVSVTEALHNAGRLMKEGRANAVKLEGGEEVCPQIKAIVSAGIPVMAHLGLTPQSVNAFGGFKVQGKTTQAVEKLLGDAKAVEEAGAFALVLECIPSQVAKLVTETVGIPTIGIGASVDCDGQILVYQDMLGLSMDFCPKFVRQYANLGEQMQSAIKEYQEDVQQGKFPAEEHYFTLSEEVLQSLY